MGHLYYVHTIVYVLYPLVRESGSAFDASGEYCLLEVTPQNDAFVEEEETYDIVLFADEVRQDSIRVIVVDNDCKKKGVGQRNRGVWGERGIQ